MVKLAIVDDPSRGGLRETMSRSTQPTTAPPAELRQRSTHPHSRKSSSLRRCMIATNVSRSCSVRMREVALSMYWPSWLQATTRGTPAALALRASLRQFLTRYRSFCRVIPGSSTTKTRDLIRSTSQKSLILTAPPSCAVAARICPRAR